MISPAEGTARRNWRRVRKIALMGAGGLALLLAVVAGLLAWEPAAYRAVAAAGDGEQAEVLARRAVSKTSAWHAALSRPGPWDVALSADEINAWLATDLPRNHARALPRGVARPRVVFRPRHAGVGCRLGLGPLSSAVWLDFEIVLRDPNHLAIVLEEARLGAIPLPAEPIVRELGHRIGRLGMVTDVRRLDGRAVLMVFIPSTHDAGATSYWLESLALEDGELLLAGETRAAGPARQPATAVEP
jgi:hypothetical protein